MKRLVYCFLLGMLVFGASGALAQDFSNKGKEFWLAYSYHVGMVNSGGAPVMTLYITSDVTTAFSVEIFGVTTLQSGTITAGQVATVNIPNAYFINNEGKFTNRAIRVSADKPVVVYSYITRSYASAATLCLPVTVLGKEYVSTNFTQTSNEPNSNSYFTIVAVEDNTTVEITPSANTKNGWLANNTYTVNLNKGEVYQVLGVTPNNGVNGVDLTGSKIRSVAAGTSGCKRIAVFSGSGKIIISANNCSQNSSDNLYQQLYPTGAWGLKYLTVPSFGRQTNIFRIIKNDPSTNVYLNGTLIPAGAFVNNYYQFSNTQPNSIVADKPISVAQYFTTQGCDGNGGPYDPDMIMLNPVEQNVDKVTLVNSNLASPVSQPSGPVPHQHHIHVIMRNGGTGISSFKLDGTPVPASSWVAHPNDPQYSYLYISNVTQGYHRIESDSGFNAIAYGYANFESYGYSAGANVKDLYQFASIQNQYATINAPNTCRNVPFYFAMTFPYRPTQIKWVFGTALNGMGIADTTISNPAHDSTWVVNGKQLYRYKLTVPYIISTLGTYPVKILAQNPTADGCSGEQEINYDLQVMERPSANFTFTGSGCLSDSVRFTESGNTFGRPATNWFWNFGDGQRSQIRNPAHLYTAAGSYNVKFFLATDIGCISDTAQKTVVITEPPVARFGVSALVCAGRAVIFTDSSTSATSAIVKWTWDFGDGSTKVVASSNAAQSHSYAVVGTYTVTLEVENAAGCKSTLFSRQVTVAAVPRSSFSFGNGCLPNAQVQFVNNSTVSDGNPLSYHWNFGDGATSTQQSPTHTYSAMGPWDVKLTTTSQSGCTHDTIIRVTTIYAQPLAGFGSPSEVCFGTAVSFQDQSSAQGSSVSSWQWHFGDGATSTQQNPTHTYQSPGTYSISLSIGSLAGCASTVFSKTIIVHALPVASFTTSSPLCATRALTFTSTSTSQSGAVNKWSWSFGDGVGTATTAAPTYSYAAMGTYTVSLQVQSDKGCQSALTSKPVVINPLPRVGFIIPGNCINDPITTFVDTSSIDDGSQSQFSWLWHFGDPNASAGQNQSSAKNGQHRYTQTGDYTVTLSVTSRDGCSASQSGVFSLNGAVPRAAFTIAGGLVHCSTDSLSLVNNSFVSPGKIVRLEIFWDYSSDPTNKDVIAFALQGAVFKHRYPSFTTPASKQYRIRVVAYSGDNCLSTLEQTVTLLATPEVFFSPVAPLCADASSFPLQAGATNLAGAGTFSGSGVSPAGVFSPTAAGAGVHPISFSYTATNGCSASLQQALTVFAVPVVSAGGDKVVLEGGSVVLEGSGSGGGISFLWSPSWGLSDATIATPVARPADDVVYTLRVSSRDGCSAEDKVLVRVLKSPTIPNVFSPNGDGINDYWHIAYLESYPGATVEVYNRYGSLVFRSQGYAKPWDGTHKGAPLPAGSYYYIVNPKNGRKQIAGFVDIIR